MPGKLVAHTLDFQSISSVTECTPGWNLAIGIFGLVILYGMPLVGSLYSSHVGHGLASLLIRGIVAMICLVPPTIFMGATLPAMARSVDTSPQGISWLAYFYAGNIAGAVCGCLLAGFYLLRIFDLATATFVAVAINLCVALFATVPRRAAHPIPQSREQ